MTRWQVSRARFAGNTSAVCSSQQLVRVEGYPGIIHRPHVAAVTGLQNEQTTTHDLLDAIGFVIITATRRALTNVRETSKQQPQKQFASRSSTLLVSVDVDLAHVMPVSGCSGTHSSAPWLRF